MDLSIFIQKDLNETCLLQEESFALNLPLQQSNIKPLGKSKTQQPQTDAQKKRDLFNLLCKVMTN